MSGRWFAVGGVSRWVDPPPPIMIRTQYVRAPRKFAPTWGKSVLAEQVSNTPNRTNHWGTGKSTRENKVVWEGSLTIRPLVTYQYIGDGFLDSFLLIYISLWHKFEDWLRWGWPEPQYWPLSIIPVIPVQCCSWYSNECMLQCYSVTVLQYMMHSWVYVGGCGAGN